MNEAQYWQICDACDRVLTDPYATEECVAIPWLHVIRGHPTLVRRYEVLLDRVSRTRHFKFFRFLAGWVRQFWLAWQSNGQPWFGPNSLPVKSDILFVSHLLDPSQAGKDSDFYFGDLPWRIRRKGHGAVVALIDHSGTADATLAGRWQSNPIPHVLLSSSLSVREEWSMWLRVKAEALLLAARSRLQPSGLHRNVLSEASLEALSGSTRTTLRMSIQIGQLVAQVQPRVIVVTYEGHAWERIAFAAARQALPGIICLGYQHAGIFSLQHAALRKLQPRFNPDHILVGGQVAKAQMELALGLKGIPISILGSSRASEAPNLSERNSRLSTCLVVPEGLIEECNFLFEFSLRCARLLPQIRFIWRLHPLIGFEELIASKSLFRNFPENIELSRRTLEEDLDLSEYALYRGTSAIIKAVIAGVQPVYVKRDGDMNIDPLYELTQWRETIVSPTDFEAIVFRQEGVAVAANGQGLAIRYCESFYCPFDVATLTSLIYS